MKIPTPPPEPPEAPTDHGPLIAMFEDDGSTDPDPVVILINNNGCAVYRMPLSVYRDMRNLKIDESEAITLATESAFEVFGQEAERESVK